MIKILAAALGIIYATTNVVWAHRLAGLPPDLSFPAPILLHLQDVHMNREAQADLARRLQERIDAGPVDAIGVEGAIGALDYAEFRPNSQLAKRRELADRFMNEGKMDAISYLGLASPSKLPAILGVEEKETYLANVEAYRRSAPLQKNARTALEQSKRQLAAEKRALFSAELLALDAHVENYRANKITLAAYLRALSVHADSVSFQVEQFLAAADLEGRLNSARLESEREALLRHLFEKMPAGEMEQMRDMGQALMSGKIEQRKFWAAVRKNCARYGVPLGHYPHLDNYIRYVLLADGIDAARLFRETRTLEEAALRFLARTPPERELLRRARGNYLRGKLITFSLTSEEWEEYRAALGAETASLRTFEDFYRIAEERNHTMVEKLLSSHGSSVVLVAGGFHSAGVSALAQQKGWTYQAMAPKITKIDADGGAAYLSVFLKKSPLEKIFQGQKLFLSPGLRIANPESQAIRSVPGIEGPVLEALEEARPPLPRGIVPLLVLFMVGLSSAAVAAFPQSTLGLIAALAISAGTFAFFNLQRDDIGGAIRLSDRIHATPAVIANANALALLNETTRLPINVTGPLNVEMLSLAYHYVRPRVAYVVDHTNRMVRLKEATFDIDRQAFENAESEEVLFLNFARSLKAQNIAMDMMIEHSLPSEFGALLVQSLYFEWRAAGRLLLHRKELSLSPLTQTDLALQTILLAQQFILRFGHRPLGHVPRSTREIVTRDRESLEKNFTPDFSPHLLKKNQPNNFDYLPQLIKDALRMTPRSEKKIAGMQSVGGTRGGILAWGLLFPLAEEALRWGAFVLFGVWGLVVYSAFHALFHFWTDIYDSKDPLTWKEFLFFSFPYRLMFSLAVFSLPYWMSLPTATAPLYAIALHIGNNVILAPLLARITGQSSALWSMSLGGMTEPNVHTYREILQLYDRLWFRSPTIARKITLDEVSRWKGRLTKPLSIGEQVLLQNTIENVLEDLSAAEKSQENRYLNREEEAILFRALRSTSMTSSQRLFLSHLLAFTNMGMIRKMVLKREKENPRLGEILQACYMQVVSFAVPAFDIARGNKFNTYIGWVVENKMKSLRPHHQTIRLPNNVYEDRGRIKGIEEEFATRNQPLPTDEQIALILNSRLLKDRNIKVLEADLRKAIVRGTGALKLSKEDRKKLGSKFLTVKKIKNIRIKRVSFVSMDTGLRTEDGQEGMEIADPKSLAEPGQEADHEELKRVLKESFRFLNKREKKVLQLRFFGTADDDEVFDKGLSLEAIAKILFISKERVRQIQNRALGIMRNRMKGHSPQSWLGVRGGIWQYGLLMPIVEEGLRFWTAALAGYHNNLWFVVIAYSLFHAVLHFPLVDRHEVKGNYFLSRRFWARVAYSMIFGLVGWKWGIPWSFAVHAASNILVRMGIIPGLLMSAKKEEKHPAKYDITGLYHALAMLVRENKMGEAAAYGALHWPIILRTVKKERPWLPYHFSQFAHDYMRALRALRQLNEARDVVESALKWEHQNLRLWTSFGALCIELHDFDYGIQRMLSFLKKKGRISHAPFWTILIRLYRLADRLWEYLEISEQSPLSPMTDSHLQTEKALLYYRLFRPEEGLHELGWIPAGLPQASELPQFLAYIKLRKLLAFKNIGLGNIAEGVAILKDLLPILHPEASDRMFILRSYEHFTGIPYEEGPKKIKRILAIRVNRALMEAGASPFLLTLEKNKWAIILNQLFSAEEVSNVSMLIQEAMENATPMGDANPAWQTGRLVYYPPLETARATKIHRLIVYIDSQGQVYDAHPEGGEAIVTTNGPQADPALISVNAGGLCTWNIPTKKAVNVLWGTEIWGLRSILNDAEPYFLERAPSYVEREKLLWNAVRKGVLHGQKNGSEYLKFDEEIPGSKIAYIEIEEKSRRFLRLLWEDPLIQNTNGTLAEKTTRNAIKIVIGCLAFALGLHVFNNNVLYPLSLMLLVSTVTIEASRPHHGDELKHWVEEGRARGLVRPDRPAIDRWKDLLRWRSGLKRIFGPSVVEYIPHEIPTRAAHTRGESASVRWILSAYERGVPAMLLLSGGGLARRVLRLFRLEFLLPMDSKALIQLATQLKMLNPAFSKTQIWAVANPYKDSFEGVEQKIKLGATEIFLQPLFTDSAFTWLQEAVKRFPKTRFVAGFSPIASSRHLRFWYFLIGKFWFPGAELKALMKEFRAQEKLGDESFQKFRRRWMADNLKRTFDILGAANFHIMLTKDTSEVRFIMDQIQPYAAVERLNKKFNIKAQVDALIWTDEKRRARLFDALRVLEKELEALPPYGRPTHVRLDWLTPKGTFLESPVMRRDFVEPGPGKTIVATGRYELAVNLEPGPLETIHEAVSAAAASAKGAAIGDFAAHGDSILWDFNGTFWRHLKKYMEATHGGDYRDEIGGTPDAKVEFVRHLAEEFFKQLSDFVAANGDRSPPAYYMEIGVATIDYADLFTAEFRRIALAAGRSDLLEKFTYVLTHYPQPFDPIEAALRGRAINGRLNGVRVETSAIDITRPDGLAPYQGKILRVHATNVFDSLPSHHRAVHDGKSYAVEVLPYVPDKELAWLASKYGTGKDHLRRALAALPSGNVEDYLTADPLFWADLWKSIVIEERYVLEPQQQASPEENYSRFPLSDWAILSVKRILPYLAPNGVVEIIDAIGTRLSDFLRRHGLQRYGGSIMNWINGVLFERALRPWADVTFSSLVPFGENKSRHRMEITLKGTPKAELWGINHVMDGAFESQVIEITAASDVETVMPAVNHWLNGDRKKRRAILYAAPLDNSAEAEARIHDALAPHADANITAVYHRGDNLTRHALDQVIATANRKSGAAATSDLVAWMRSTDRWDALPQGGLLIEGVLLPISSIVPYLLKLLEGKVLPLNVNDLIESGRAAEKAA